MRKGEKIGIDSIRATEILLKIIKEEGIHEKHAKAIFVLSAKSMKNRRTVNEEEDFEEAARKIFKKFKEKINNGDYHETVKEISKLFYDPSFINHHYRGINIFLTSAAVVVPIILFVINLFIGK